MMNDANATLGYRTSDAEMLGWLNDAINSLLNLKPGLFAKNVLHTCAGGYAQYVNLSRAVQVLEVVGIPEADRSTLTQFKPGWITSTQDATVNWMRSPAEPLRFDVYPPAIENATLPILYVEAPALLVAVGDLVKVSENYEPVLVDFLVGRVEMKDDEHVNSTRAAQMMTRFEEQVKGVA